MKLIREYLNEDDMGGVGSPMSTPNNVPGMGTATPGGSTNIGSGDNWGFGSMYTQNGKIKSKKKKRRKTKIKTLKQHMLRK